MTMLYYYVLLCFQHIFGNNFRLYCIIMYHVTENIKELCYIRYNIGDIRQQWGAKLVIYRHRFHIIFNDFLYVRDIIFEKYI